MLQIWKYILSKKKKKSNEMRQNQTKFSRTDGSSNYQSLCVSRVSGIYDDNGIIHQWLKIEKVDRK